MTYTPRFIILTQVMRYLPHDKRTQLWKELGSYSSLPQHKYFYALLEKYFDWELFKTKPLLWQDIWLYNYIKYDGTRGMTSLIRKYEKEAFVDDDDYFQEIKDEINRQGLSSSFISKKVVIIVNQKNKI